ncbi:MAG TPA: LLM class flavin-dependent oxidoreductase [Pseudonocardiaceae bacterium]|nr:LLM class flavin-dependent oxidoreductase [Pseudonocardiaceae bacterium]
MVEPILRHGVYLPPFGPLGDPSTLVDLAVRAEAAGWDGVFLWDHVATDFPPIADPWTTLAAIAQATSRILVGPTVTPLPRRRPWLVARQAATVSRLSGGRLVVGAGIGTDESGDQSRFGEVEDASTRGDMLDEGLAVLRAMWAGEAVCHRGTHYRVDLPETEPEPYPIPVWLAASTHHRRVLRRAAAHDGIFPNTGTLPTPEEIAGLLTALRAEGLPGDKPFDVVVTGNASHGWPEPHHVDLAGLHDAGMTWWMESLIHFDPLDMSLAVVDAGPPRV